MVSPEEENTVPDSPMNRGTESDLLLQTWHGTNPPPPPPPLKHEASVGLDSLRCSSRGGLMLFNPSLARGDRGLVNLVCSRKRDRGLGRELENVLVFWTESKTMDERKVQREAAGFIYYKCSLVLLLLRLLYIFLLFWQKCLANTCKFSLSLLFLSCLIKMPEK